MIQQNSEFNVLYISDVEATKSFYEKLGASIKQIETDKVVVGLSNFDLHFILETTEPFAEYQYITERNGRGQGALFYVGVDSIEDFFQELINKGLKTVTPIIPNHWDSKEFLIEDPDGYKLVFYQV